MLRQLRTWLKKIRNKLLNINSIQARFDIIQSKLDSVGSCVADIQHSHEEIKKNFGELSKQSISNQSELSNHSIHPYSQNSYLNVSNRSVSRNTLVPMSPHESIRVVFYVQHASVWPSWRSVWEASMADTRFVPKLVLTPFFHEDSSVSRVYDDLRRFFINQNIPFLNFELFNLEEFAPHVVFLQNPYDETRPESLRCDSLVKSGYRIAYIPYCLEMGGGIWNIDAQFNSPLHQLAWKMFVRSQPSKTMFAKYCRTGNDHVVVTGHPKFDLDENEALHEVSSDLLKKIADRKVILWTPHFSVGQSPQWSTYRVYGSLILGEMNRRNDLFLLVRPHPLFFKAMRNHGIWNAENESSFRQRIHQSPNMDLDDDVDYHAAFGIADALMADVGSFLLEFLPTGKPILYLVCPGGLGMNDDGALAQHLYVASSSSDIISFMSMISRSEDPMKTNRQAIVPEFLYGLDLDSTAGERIVQHIQMSLGTGGAISSNTIEHHTGQRQSEKYWGKTSNTYLAPDEFYERVETLMDGVLTALPKMGNAIDIGCGDGRFTLKIANHVNRITGYDISPILIAKAIQQAIAGNTNNAEFMEMEIDSIRPLEKYELVVCMGVTSCIIDDVKFLRILDRLALLVRPDGYLIMRDTLSNGKDQTFSDESGFISKYRAVDDYLELVTRRGFYLSQEFVVKELSESALINKLFVFQFHDQGPHIFP